jgi:hypothetical protein
MFDTISTKTHPQKKKNLEKKEKNNQEFGAFL